MSSAVDSLPLALLISLFCWLAAVSQAQPDGHGPRAFPPPHHDGHHGPSLLPFLRNVSRAEAREFFQIASSENQTKSAIKSGLRSWAQSAGVANVYANFTAQQQQRAEQFHANVSANLAGQALQLFNQLWAITQNDGITRVAECQQIRSAMNGTSPLVRRLVPVPAPSIPAPPPRGCRPPRPPHPRPPHGGGSRSGSRSVEEGGGGGGGNNNNSLPASGGPGENDI